MRLEWACLRIPALICLVACPAWAAVPRGVDLAALQGWDMVVADEAIPSEAYAAEEFQRLVGEATGVTLPVVKPTDRPDRHVFIGPGRLMRASAAGFAVDDFGPEDLRIVVRDDLIVIAGGRPRGTLYGVYVFLEDCVGVRFLTGEHTYVPRLSEWHVVGPIDRFYHPPLEMRWSYYGEINGNPAFAVRVRNNTTAGDAKFGGVTGQSLISHSFLGLIPSSKYGKEHPEYYCLRDGKRLAQVENDAFGNEPCLTNPDVLRIVTEAVLAELQANPGRKNISVSQNDNAACCQCPNCAAIDQREGTPMGSLLTFVNAVADAVAAKRPGVMVGTLSYWYTRKPPKTIRPRPNVQIQLCSIECCQTHAINDPNCPKNAEFCRDMTEWGKICDNIFVWNYNTNFSNYLLPFPNLPVIEPNVRYFLGHHARGAFMQAAGDANGAEMSELRNYVISALLWDPSRSGRQLMTEFLELHYGPAAGPIRRFIDLVHQRAEASGRHQACFGDAEQYGLDDPMVVQAGLDAFAEAMRLADSDALKARVEKASVCAYRLAIEPACRPKTKPLDPEVVKRLQPLAKRFFEICDKHHIDTASEGRKVETFRQRIKEAGLILDSASSKPQ